MKSIAIKVACVLLLASGSAWAEIYETTDSEGNKVFTDSPTGAAEVVDLPKANIADSVEPAPVPPASPARTATKPAAGNTGEIGDDGVYIIGDQHNERLEENVARERRHEVLEGERPKEVLDGEAPREVLDAEHRVEGADAEAVRKKEGAAEGAVARPHRAVHHRR